MNESRRLTIEISADLVATVNEAVGSGLYSSTDALVTEALRTWFETHPAGPYIFAPVDETTAAQHDAWFRAEVQKTLDGLRDGTVEILSDEEHQARRERKRAELMAKIG